MHLLCLLVLPLATEHYCEVVHAVKCVGMLFAQRLLLQLERLPMHLLRLLIFPENRVAFGYVKKKTPPGFLVGRIPPKLQGGLRMRQILSPYVSVLVLWERKRLGEPLYHLCDTFLPFSFVLQPVLHR